MKSILGTALVAVFATFASAQYAYVANLNSNNVSVVNLATNTVVATVTVGNTPYDVAVSPTGSQVYVANFNSDNVSLINTSTNSVTGTVPVQLQPYGVAVSPDGAFLYVTNNQSDDVSVINLANNTLQTVIAVGYQPRGVAINPANTYAYVTNFNGSTQTSTTVTGTVSAINLNGYAQTTITVGVSAFSIAINPSGTTAYVTNNGAATVSVINLSNNTVTATVNVGNGPKGVAVIPDGTQVWVANNTDNTISVISAASNTVINTLNAGNSPVGVAMNPAGNYAYVTNTLDNTMSVFNIATGNLVKTVNVGSFPTGIAVGPATVSINAGGIVNAGSYTTPVAPGSLAAVFGSFPVVTTQAGSVPWSTTLGGLSMQFNSTAAPFYYVSSTQANVQVPWELAGKASATVVASAGGGVSAAQTVPLASVAPSIFVMNPANQGAITDQTGALSGPSNPAKAGTTYISIYCTGLGPVSNQPATGAAASTTTLSNTASPVTVTVGGVTVPAYFAGLAPGEVGVNQVNVQVPAGVAAGSAVPLYLTIGGVKSNTVTLGVD